MTSYPNYELPPADFVAFLAQRAGLTQEAAEHTLERWFGEYQAKTSDRPASQRFERSASAAA